MREQTRADNLTIYCCKNNLMSAFNASVLLLTINFVITLSISCLRIHTYFDNVMMKFMINNRTDAWKTDANLLNGH